MAGILVAAAFLYFLAYDPARFGPTHDDGVYVETARALATGEGCRIISLRYVPAETKYPPFYPFLLSLIWRLDPQFPRNLNSMIILTAAATLSFLALTWRYLYTGRKTAHFLPMSPGIDWQNDPRPIFDIVDQSDGRYLVVTRSDFEFNRFKNLIEAHGEEFVPVFNSADGQSTIYHINRSQERH